MTAKDLSGEPRSFLTAEEGFRYVKHLHARNMIVPVVGDFGGPDATRRVSGYVRAHDAAVHAFYASNVGAYLTKEQYGAFCDNLATLPARSARAVHREQSHAVAVVQAADMRT